MHGVYILIGIHWKFPWVTRNNFYHKQFVYGRLSSRDTDCRVSTDPLKFNNKSFLAKNEYNSVVFVITPCFFSKGWKSIPCIQGANSDHLSITTSPGVLSKTILYPIIFLGTRATFYTPFMSLRKPYWQRYKTLRPLCRYLQYSKIGS
jgi:hypothetical protein